MGKQVEVPEGVLELAACAAYRRSFENAPEIRRPYRESDWEKTADEPTRQHFRDLVRPVLIAALPSIYKYFSDRLLSREALQAGADAICLEPPAGEADRNEVRIEIEAALQTLALPIGEGDR